VPRLERGEALICIDGERRLLLEHHGGHERVLCVDHDERDVHLAAARLLGEQSGLHVVSVDERLVRRRLKPARLLDIALAGLFAGGDQIRLGIAGVRDDLESDHGDFLFGCHSPSIHNEHVLILV